MDIDKKTLKKIHAALPYGAQKKIAEQTGKTKEYVNAVLRGVVAVNVDIVAAAQELIRDKQAMEKRVLDKVRKTLEG